MNEFLSPHARAVLGESRQCTATAKASGERCGRASSVGAFTCDLHGGKSPLSIRGARERLLALTEPALNALFNALRSGPPCPACGRSDSDRDPVVVRAATVVLDRCGLGAQMKLEVSQAPRPYAEATPEEILARIELIREATLRVIAQRASDAPEITDSTPDGADADEVEL